MQLLAERHPKVTTEANGNPAPPAIPESAERFAILVLRSNQEIEVIKYRRDGDLLMFQDAQGRKGSVAVSDVDWRKTSEMTSEVRSVDSRVTPLAIN
jgi:hypothetical protein